MEDKENNLHILDEGTSTFIRALIDLFNRNTENQIDTSTYFWNDVAKDLISCAESGKLNKKIIYTRDGKEEYLIRHYLLNERPKLRVTLHNALRSDEDSLHNHPWPWASLIITGGYWEETPEGKFWRAPGNFRIRKAKDLHKLIVDPNVGPVWTLFIMGEKEQDWGFLEKDGSIEQWQQYLFNKTGVWYND